MLKKLKTLFRPGTADKQADGFAVQAAWLTAAKIVGLVMSFLLPLLLVRKLDQNEYGLYKQAFQVLTTALSLLGLQVSGSVYYFIPRQPDKKAQIAMNATLFYLMVGGAVALWFILQPRWITVIFKDDSLVPVVPLLGLALMLWLIASTFEGLMIADGDTRRASLMIAVLQLCKIALLLSAALWHGSTYALVLAAVIFGALHCSLFFLYLYRRYGRFWRPIDWSLFKTQIANSLPFGLGGMALGVQTDLHNYFVSHYFDAAMFAIYSVGCFQLPIFVLLLDSVDTIMIPEVARLEKEGKYHDIVATWMGGIRLVSFWLVPACAVMFVLRNDFITALFTTKYLASAPIFAVSLCNMLLSLHLTGPVLRAFAEFRYYRLLQCIVFLPLTWFALSTGVQVAGLLGAIAATAAMRGLDVLVTVVLLGKKLHLSRHDLRFLGPLLKIAAAATLSSLAVLALRPWFPAWPALALFLTGSAIFGTVYFAAAFMLGAVTETEKATLRRILGKILPLKTPQVADV